MKRTYVALAFAGMLAGCAGQSKFTPMPVGVGGGPNALRRTPCAGAAGSPCAPVRNRGDLPGFMLGDLRAEDQA